MTDFRDRSVGLRVSYRTEPERRAPSRARLRPHSALVAAARRRSPPARKPLSRSRPALSATSRRSLTAVPI
ncbi:MAG: hypothetical protein ABI981_02760 [Betaproteobacteria bacterium]